MDIHATDLSQAKSCQVGAGRSLLFCASKEVEFQTQMETDFITGITAGLNREGPALLAGTGLSQGARRADHYDDDVERSVTRGEGRDIMQGGAGLDFMTADAILDTASAGLDALRGLGNADEVQDEALATTAVPERPECNEERVEKEVSGIAYQSRKEEEGQKDGDSAKEGDAGKEEGDQKDVSVTLEGNDRKEDEGGRKTNDGRKEKDGRKGDGWKEEDGRKEGDGQKVEECQKEGEIAVSDGNECDQKSMTTVPASR